jgi:hypothetical protein
MSEAKRLLKYLCECRTAMAIASHELAAAGYTEKGREMHGAFDMLAEWITHIEDQTTEEQ